MHSPLGKKPQNKPYKLTCVFFRFRVEQGSSQRLLMVAGALFIIYNIYIYIHINGPCFTSDIMTSNITNFRVSLLFCHVFHVICFSNGQRGVPIEMASAF